MQVYKGQIDKKSQEMNEHSDVYNKQLVRAMEELVYKRFLDHLPFPMINEDLLSKNPYNSIKLRQVY